MSKATTYIVEAKRSPIGGLLGGLSKLTAPAIGAQVAKALLEATKTKPEAVDEVVMGEVLQAGVGQNPARQIALGAGLPDTISCVTINKVCGSGLQSVMFADMMIRAGEAEVVLAGGAESMTLSPHFVRNMRAGTKFGNVELIDSMLYDGLTNTYDNTVMGLIAEETGVKAGITRQQMDEFAVRSHQRAAKASAAGWFNDARVPIKIPRAEAPFNNDETIRGDVAYEKLAALKPAFKPDGAITAGNASSISDGAAMALVASEAGLRKCGAAPVARIIGHTTAGGPPRELFFAPIAACKKLCEKLGWERSKVDLWEINEAFASQMLACMKGLELSPDVVNVHGGAIALGHPIGASGTRVLETLIHALKRNNLKRGVASLCLGGGNAVALGVEIV